MTTPQDIEKPFIPEFEEYIRQKSIGGFTSTYDIVSGSAERKRRKHTQDEIAILRTIRTHDTATEKQIAGIIGKSEETVKTLIATLIKENTLERNSINGQNYWELIY